MATNNTTVDLAALPTPDHLTLFLKYHKSTVLLSVLPETSFPEIRRMLLAALKSRNLVTFPGTSIALPDDSEDLELGVLRDKKDASKGWTLLEIKEQDVTDNKGGKKKVGGKKSVLNDSPAGAGLGDTSWIAYRMRREIKLDEDGDAVLDGDDDPGFDVVIPSYDDDDEEEEGDKEMDT